MKIRAQGAGQILPVKWKLATERCKYLSSSCRSMPLVLIYSKTSHNEHTIVELMKMENTFFFGTAKVAVHAELFFEEVVG